MDVFTFNNPDAHAFLPACIYIARIFNCHLRISGMEAASMFVIEALLAPDKYFP